ncbi:MAG: PucR family transcriptional regulator [Mycobacteriales bacterium]
MAEVAETRRRTSPASRLAVLMDENLDAIVDHTVRLSQQRIEAFSAFDPAELAPETRTVFERGVEATADGRGADSSDLAVVTELARVRAEQGVPMDALLTGAHLTVTEVLALACAWAEEHDLGPGAVAEFGARLRDWSGDVLARMGTAHAEALERMAGGRHLESVLERLLTGALDLPGLASAAPRWGMRPGTDVYVVHTRAAGPAAVRDLRRVLLGPASGAGVVGEVHGALCAVVPRQPTALHEPDTVAGVDGPVRLWQAHLAYARASEAYEAASTFGRPGLHTLADVALEAAVLRCHDLGDALAARINGALDQNPAGSDLETTARLYLTGRRDVHEVAKTLYIHPNTVRYRLRRFQDLTNTSLEDPRTQIHLTWALYHRQLTTPTP